MTREQALAAVQKITRERKVYPFAWIRDEQHQIGFQELPTVGAGPPVPTVLGFGPSWDDAVRMMEEVP